jgi:HAD superfamily hydrolase (TIGR01509 family)
VNTAVLFDLDGVLVDACDLHYQALNEALVAHGFEAIQLDKHLDFYNGLPTKTKLHLMGIPQEKAKEIEATKQDLTIKLIETTIKRDTEKIKLLQDLKKLGHMIACVTNCSPKTAALMLAKSGLIRYINVVVTNAEVKDPKPSPEGYNLAMTKLRVNPQNCIVVEDSPKGIAAGKASGARVIQVKNPSEVTIRVLMRYLP